MDIKLQKELHEFIDNLCYYCEDPSSWPLSHDEQMAFVKRTIYIARKIQNSEPFLANKVALAAEEVKRVMEKKNK